MSIRLLLFAALAAFSPGRLQAANITNAQGGYWSLPSTWVGGVVPTASDSVSIIIPGVAVTVDIATATASTVTVNGILQFSTVSNSSLTIVGGDLTVNPGGTLRMGTAEYPIPPGVSAHLVLAKGGGPALHGLTVRDGGNFIVRGATKTPFGFLVESFVAGNTFKISASSAVGWAVGDEITFSPGAFFSNVSHSTITAISGTDPLTISFEPSGFSRFTFPETPVVVSNLTRNVLVRSSGTDVNAGLSGDSAFINNLATNATSFSLNYGEFAFIGRNFPSSYGIMFLGSGVRGTISSCTVRNGFIGAYMYQAASNTISANNFYGNVHTGVNLEAVPYGVVTGNNVISGGLGGILLNASHNSLVSGNHSYAIGNGPGISILSSNYVAVSDNWVYNNNTGLGVNGSGWTTLARNKAHSNTGFGVYVISAGDLLAASNEAYQNSSAGLALTSSSATLITNRLYGNGRGLYLQAADALAAGDWYGYTAAGQAIPSTAGEVYFEPAVGNETLVAKRDRINPAVGISTEGLNQAGVHFLSYNQDYDTGTVRLWGDYTLSGSTWTFDMTQQLYPSTHTAFRVMRGAGHSLYSMTTDDGSALNELITLTAVDTDNWRVEGSSSGVLDPAFNCPPIFVACLFSSPKFTFRMDSGATQPGDRIEFATIAGSGDAGRDKFLQFGRSADSYRGGKSKLTIAPDAGIVLIGSTAYLGVGLYGAAPYYAFVSSGAFTARYAYFTNMDPDGLQLSGNAGVSISSSAFDFMGDGAATSTYITARDLTSTAVLDNIAFETSRPLASATTYNVLVAGADSGLNWSFTTRPNPPLLWGEDFEFDPNNKVSWSQGSTVTLTGYIVFASSITAQFILSGSPPTSYEMDVSTAFNFTGSVSSVSAAGSATGLSVTGLAPNTSYFFRVGALFPPAVTYDYLAAVSTVTLAAAPTPLPFSAIGLNAFTANWDRLNNPSDTVYAVEVSTVVDFGLILTTSNTANGFAEFTGLTSGVIHYVRLRAINRAGTPSDVVLIGAVQTAAGVITLSADQLASFYNRRAFISFSAQGASHYHYRISADPTEIPAGSDPIFDGSLLRLAVPEGENYFHALGHDGAHSLVGVAHYGPLWVDRSSPTVVSIAAQRSGSDAAPLFPGQATAASVPRFYWPEPTSFAPVIGYSYGVFTDPLQVPPLTANTTLLFRDQPFSSAGTYYFKVRALDQTGNWGDPVSFTYVFTGTPLLTTRFIPYNNVFNPLRGEQMTLTYSLATPGHVSVKLYSEDGSLVKVLVDEAKSAGEHSAAWRGVNDGGSTVASGIYLLDILAPDFKKTMKIGVLK